MASSLNHNQLPNIHGGATAAPPPTPSSQTNHLSTSAAADALSKLLHRLPPNLSLPTRRSPSVIAPPTISFSESPNPDLLNHLLSAASELGFFQLTDHKISSHLALSAESESAALFNLSAEKKESLFPKNWPLGFKGDGDEESDGSGDSLCFDSRLCFSDSAEISLHSLTEFVLEMESLGLKIVEFLFRAIGFENPIGEDRTGFRSLVWISEGCRGTEPAMAGGFYPYIVGLQYQSRNQRCSLLGDSGWVAAAAAADSVMVSIGDVAQERESIIYRDLVKKLNNESTRGTESRRKTMERHAPMFTVASLTFTEERFTLSHEEKRARRGSPEETCAPTSQGKLKKGNVKACFNIHRRRG
ncbi:1-aminocyclopropane-1-carboxylate oxidase [Cucumis melo var. makuwa]|uniref:1-aminocyclopropane-1-carboxylate oxidase n=1 Tax=Cucumis melo var. makuwa TaxID=1194695 RepID=A0A5A7UEE7_CUCMM|nr:1-aminocyclopropane-1-carboxylate oxidase [Cucumis melo var. makuwa]TYK14473.1 1-aminocyclopropane-1-carboxylate oxidase [Cucumis melo var. makuwa]